MQIGRTNASTGGGTTKTPYDEWQEGFNANWDSVVANTNLPQMYKTLHVYYVVDKLQLNSTIPQLNVAIYNGNTYRYQQLQIDSVSGIKYIDFLPTDYITNSYDNKKYVCVIYCASNFSNNIINFTNIQLPLVYLNNNGLNGLTVLQQMGAILNLNTATIAFVPFVRGVDLDYISNVVNIGCNLEHLTFKKFDKIAFPSFAINTVSGSDIQAQIAIDLYQYMIDNSIPLDPILAHRISVNIGCVKLNDYFFNTMLFNLADVSCRGFTSAGYVNYAETYKIPTTPYKTIVGYYPAIIPSCVHIDGVFEEIQTPYDNQGLHGFSNQYTIQYRNLVDFPMWKVLGSATTGCLMPSTKVNNAYHSFGFYSTLLNPKKFAEFDINGNIIEDPTKYFICNLPVVNPDMLQRVTFSNPATTFKNWFTTTQQAAIGDYLTAKGWTLAW